MSKESIKTILFNIRPTQNKNIKGMLESKNKHCLVILRRYHNAKLSTKTFFFQCTAEQDLNQRNGPIKEQPLPCNS